MILPDTTIRWMLENKHIVIDPKPTRIQPTSVDLHLGPVLINEDGREIELVSLRGVGGYRMNPGSFFLGATLERVEVPINLVGILMGKSTLARMGLQIEAAGYVDPGWKGNLTLELKNLTQRQIIGLHYGMKICQIRFEVLWAEVSAGYGDLKFGSHYQESIGPVEADRSGLYSREARSDPARE
jgi:dCTP deaminase